MSVLAAELREPAGSGRTARENEQTVALLLVRTHITANYRPGERLTLAVGARQPAARALAVRLGLREQYVSTALRTLDVLGEIQAGGNRGALVLGPYDLHEDDVALDAAVRQRIRDRHYTVGHALPTGLLGEEFRLSAECVERALRRLVREGWLHRNPRGVHGPGYYVTLPLPKQRSRSASPAVRPPVADGAP